MSWFRGSPPGARPASLEASLEQQICGALHSARRMVTMGRNAERLFEDARKMISAELCDLRQRCQGNFLRDMSVDKFEDKILLSRRQAAPPRCRMQDVVLPTRMTSSIGKTGRRSGAATQKKCATGAACAGPGVNSGSFERWWVTRLVCHPLPSSFTSAGRIERRIPATNARRIAAAEPEVLDIPLRPR
jgi:hypothetical protein